MLASAWLSSTSETSAGNLGEAVFCLSVVTWLSEEAIGKHLDAMAVTIIPVYDYGLESGPPTGFNVDSLLHLSSCHLYHPT